MPRYVIYALGVEYADVVLPANAAGPVAAARYADERVGSLGKSYRTVSYDDPSAEYCVYRVRDHFPANDRPMLDQDCRVESYVAVDRG